MPPLTEEYVNAKTEQILKAVKSGFDGVAVEFTDVRSQMSEQRQDIASIKTHLQDHEARFTRIEQTLETLVQSVDRFAKIYTDLNQELTVLRQHVRDMEARLGKVELKLAT